jgi:hypothetical protein
MASITFSGVWLNAGDDLSNSLYLDTAVSVSGDKARRGETRTYAGGRIRLITRPGTAASVDVTSDYTTRTSRDWLESVVGELILYRDGRGRKLWGTILAVHATEVRGAAELVNLSFTVNEITHSEEV